jgi:MFS transporter, PPP family, 3-phenylpropionic acid transporter
LAPLPASASPGVPARFALLFAAQFAAIGAMMPFLPVVLQAKGLSAEQVSAVLAAGSAVRLLAAPAIGRGADGLGDPRRVLVLAAAVAGCTACGYALAPGGFAPLLLVALLHSLFLAPVVPLSDALWLGASRRLSFDYGRVRSAGSAAYILGAVAAGQAVALAGPASAVWLYAGGLLLAALAARSLPAEPRAGGRGRAGFAAPFRDASFRWLLPLSALIQGSHALYYGFSTIHWTAAGLSPAVIGLLWAEGVVVEVLMFLWSAPLVARLGPAGLALLAAGAGVVRWAVTAETTWLPALAAVQVLHALTFGAQHLGAMRVLATLPPGQAATAQTLHSSLGTGLAMGVLTLLSGTLYDRLGGGGFWAMAGLCAAALPVALGLRAALRRRGGARPAG